MDEKKSSSPEPARKESDKPALPAIAPAVLPHSEPPRRKGRINQFSILILLIAVTAAIFPIVLIFFVPVTVAATLSTLFFPLYQWFLKTFRNRSGLASIACCLVILLCLLAPLYIVVYLVIQQSIQLYHSIGPDIKDIIDKGSNSAILIHLRNLAIFQKTGLSSVDLAGPLQSAAKTLLGSLTTILSKTSSGVLSLLLNIFILFFTMFYFFRDGESLVKRLKYLVPIRNDYEDMIIARFLLISRATVMGTMIMGITQGVVGSLTLIVLGVKGWILWGFVMTILAILPFVGTWTVLIPAGIIYILMGMVWQGIVMIIMGFVVIPNIDNVLRPRLVGRGAKMHDLIIFFSTLGGIAVFGVMGFIVGPVVAALFIAVLDIYSMEFEQELKDF